MPLGWECRAKLVKQNPAKPATRRGPVSGEIKTPASNAYPAPQLFCGNGFGSIKRAPAFTFGYLTKVSLTKPVTTPYAPLFNVQGLLKSGPYKVTHGVVSPHLNPICDSVQMPGPGAHTPKSQIRYKRPPEYTMRPAARPPYQPWDQWTPPPNMYCPPIPVKKPPAYTLGYKSKGEKDQDLPGPGEHDPNFNYVRGKTPAYTFGHPFKPIKPLETPPPNTYCEKKYMVSKRTSPAPSFGIRHSRYMGQREVFLKSSNLDIALGSG